MRTFGPAAWTPPACCVPKAVPLKKNPQRREKHNVFDLWPLAAQHYFPLAKGAWISSPPTGKFQVSAIVLDMDFIHSE
jgi:hypothetical protein